MPWISEVSSNKTQDAADPGESDSPRINLLVDIRVPAHPLTNRTLQGSKKERMQVILIRTTCVWKTNPKLIRSGLHNIHLDL